MIEGNDGGIGITHDRGRNWTFDDKIPVGQFYHINTDNEMPYNVMGGLQGITEAGTAPFTIPGSSIVAASSEMIIGIILGAVMALK